MDKQDHQVSSVSEDLLHGLKLLDLAGGAQEFVSERTPHTACQAPQWQDWSWGNVVHAWDDWVLVRPTWGSASTVNGFVKGENKPPGGSRLESWTADFCSFLLLRDERGI